MTAERNVDAPVSGAPLRVALLGCGVVGTAVAQRLVAQAADFAARAGRPLEIVGVAVRREGVDRSATGLDESLFTTDAEGLVARADLVVELMGGIEPARRLILAALERGTSVVTANKALMAREGAALHEAAHRAGADLYYEAAVAGELMFYGQGAGGAPTSSAVLGDVIAAARHIVAGARGPGESAYADLPVLALDSVQTRYHISLDVEDRPGVLARVAAVFSDHEVSIESVRQRLVEGDDGAEQRASLVVVTHGARDAALAATTEALAADPSVRRLCSVIRVEGGL